MTAPLTTPRSMPAHTTVNMLLTRGSFMGRAGDEVDDVGTAEAAAIVHDGTGWLIQ